MLTQITISNFTIVDKLDLELSRGLNIITGETGAGKSIIIDALGLTLGDRADPGTVRSGSERAEIIAHFDCTENNQALHWLKTKELDADNECLLRRTISREGRSKAYINGTPCTLHDLKVLGEILLNIHGQHEHQSLGRKETHRDLLDQYANLGTLANSTADHYQRWQIAAKELKSLEDNADEKQSRAELLSYQVSELDELNLQSGELVLLEEKHKQLSNCDLLKETGHQALSILNGDDTGAITSLLHQTRSLLTQMASENEASLVAINNMLSEASIQIDEAHHDLSNFLLNLHSDPEQLQSIDQRMGQAHHLARKHRVPPSQLVEHHCLLQEEFASIDNLDERLEELRQKTADLQHSFMDQALCLSKKRHSAAKKFDKLISERMDQLGMHGGLFQTDFKILKGEQTNKHGIDQIEFLVAPNKGQAAKPLSKVASGGELSRISLAIQVIYAEKAAVPTLIFDEVDVGIGGGTAEVVGRLLRTLSEKGQVLCVTHLPQVAAQGQHHYFVQKTQEKKATHTDIRPLNNDEKVVEIARMLGGLKLTEQTLSHAKEMLVQAQEYSENK